MSERFAMDKKKIIAGDRVQLSALGRERCPRVRWQAGTVLRVLAYQCDVLFDSNKTFTTVHVTYLELLTENGGRDP